MFDTVAGLPVHALVVHGVVVLAPIMCLVTVAVAARPRWRERFGWAVVVADALLLGLVWVTAQAGEALQDRLGGEVAEEHGERGEVLWVFAAALLAAAVLAAVAGRRRALGPVALVLAVVAALAFTVWVVVTGHSGTASVWQDVVSSTSPG